MSMRPQVIEAALTYDTPSRIGAGDNPLGNAYGQISIMESQYGQIQIVPSTEFVVIEHLGSSPSCPTNLAVAYDPLWRAFIQIRINSTEYFISPDNGQDDGVPGWAAPYPISDAFQPSFILYPDVYVLPGQAWDLLYKLGDNFLIDWDFVNDQPVNDGDTGFYGPVYVFCKYTLYDGIDAVVANRLLELGITIKPENIDWFKRVVLAQETGVQEPTQRGEEIPGQAPQAI